VYCDQISYLRAYFPTNEKNNPEMENQITGFLLPPPPSLSAKKLFVTTNLSITRNAIWGFN